MGNKLNKFLEYFLKYSLPLLVTVIPATFWLSSLLTKMDGNIQLLTNTLNESVIPILEEISGQRIAKIKPIVHNTIRQSFADSLYRQQEQLANRIDRITLVAQNGTGKTIEENVRPLLPAIYSFLAQWHSEKGNKAEARVALNSYFGYYAENRKVKPQSDTYEMMKKLEGEYRDIANK